MINLRNKVLHNTSMLYVMNIAKMVFPLITLPYLTRVLSVPCYGVVTYVKAVMQYMQLIIDFGFLLSGTKDIVLAGEDQNTINHEIGNILLAKLLLVGAAFLSLCVIIPLIRILRENLYFTMLSFVVVALTVLLMDFYFRGIERMEIITVRFVVMKGIATALTFVFVHHDGDIMWIPVLDIIGSVIAVGLVWIQLKRFNVRMKFDGFGKAFQKLKESAIYFFSNMATTAFTALNTLLIGIYINEVDVAYWGLCTQLVGAAQSFYTPVINGIYPQMVRTKDKKLIWKTMLVFSPVIVLGCAFTLLVAKQVLIIISGKEYGAAAYLLRLLVPVLFFSFPSMLFGWPTLGAIGKQRETTITTVAAASFQVLLLALLIVLDRFNLVSIAIARGITEALLFAMRFSYYWRYKREFTT